MANSTIQLKRKRPSLVLKRKRNVRIKLNAKKPRLVLQHKKTTIVLKHKVGTGTGTGDLHFEYPFTNSSYILVLHNLSKRPAVTVISSAGDEVIGDVFYPNDTSVIVTFTASFSGTILCN